MVTVLMPSCMYMHMAGGKEAKHHQQTSINNFPGAKTGLMKKVLFLLMIWSTHEFRSMSSL